MYWALFIGSLVCVFVGVMALSRELPAQNIAFIVLFLAAVECGFEYLTKSGNLICGVLFWPGAILLSRMMMQRALKPWRRASNYGWFLLGASSIATAALSWVAHSVIEGAERLGLTAVSLLILTPWFLKKRITAFEESRE